MSRIKRLHAVLFAAFAVATTGAMAQDASYGVISLSTSATASAARPAQASITPPPTNYVAPTTSVCNSASIAQMAAALGSDPNMAVPLRACGATVSYDYGGQSVTVTKPDGSVLQVSGSTMQYGANADQAAARASWSGGSTSDPVALSAQDQQNVQAAAAAANAANAQTSSATLATITPTKPLVVQQVTAAQVQAAVNGAGTANSAGMAVQAAAIGAATAAAIESSGGYGYGGYNSYNPAAAQAAAINAAQQIYSSPAYNGSGY